MFVKSHLNANLESTTTTTVTHEVNAKSTNIHDKDVLQK